MLSRMIARHSLSFILHLEFLMSFISGFSSITLVSCLSVSSGAAVAKVLQLTPTEENL